LTDKHDFCSMALKSLNPCVAPLLIFQLEPPCKFWLRAPFPFFCDPLFTLPFCFTLWPILILPPEQIVKPPPRPFPDSHVYFSCSSNLRPPVFSSFPLRLGPSGPVVSPAGFFFFSKKWSIPPSPPPVSRACFAGLDFFLETSLVFSSGVLCSILLSEAEIGFPAFCIGFVDSCVAYGDLSHLHLLFGLSVCFLPDSLRFFPPQEVLLFFFPTGQVFLFSLIVGFPLF